LLSYGPPESKQDPEVDAEDEEDLSSFKRIAQEVFDLPQLLKPSLPELRATYGESADVIFEGSNPKIPQSDLSDHQPKDKNDILFQTGTRHLRQHQDPYFPLQAVDHLKCSILVKSNLTCYDYK
jgi:hypothetical protein